MLDPRGQGVRYGKMMEKGVWIEKGGLMGEENMPVSVL